MARNETIYCSGRCGRPAIREIDGMPWCKPCLVTEGYSEAEGVVIHQAAPMMGGSVARPEPEVASGKKKPRARAFKPKPETASAAVDRVMAEVPRPLTCKNPEHKKPVPLIRSNKSGWCSQCQRDGTRYRAEKAPALDRIGKQLPITERVAKQLEQVRPARKAAFAVCPPERSVTSEPQNGGGSTSAAALTMRVMSAAEYSELTNRYLSTELEQLVAEVRNMIVKLPGGRLVVDPPKGRKARPFRDQVQRYFDRWHKDLKIHVTQNVKLNHIAVMADANTGRHAARPGKG